MLTMIWHGDFSAWRKKFLVHQTTAVVAVQLLSTEYFASSLSKPHDMQRDLTNFLSRCVSHTSKFQKSSICQRLILNMLELCCFPDLSLLLCPARGSNKRRRVEEVFSDQSEQDASPVVTVLCSKQFWEQKNVGSHKLQRRKNSRAWQTNIFPIGV